MWGKKATALLSNELQALIYLFIDRENDAAWELKEKKKKRMLLVIFLKTSSLFTYNQASKTRRRAFPQGEYTILLYDLDEAVKRVLIQLACI